MSSTDDARDELLDDEFRWRRLLGDLFHRFRVNEGSARDAGEVIVAAALASQLAMNEASAPSRIRLYIWPTDASSISGGGGVYVDGARRRVSRRSLGILISRDPPGRTYALISRCHRVVTFSVAG
jgi:hypothetical protein